MLALTGYFEDTGYLVSLPQWNFDNTPIIGKCCSNYQSVTPLRQILEDNSCLNLNFHHRENFALNFRTWFSPWSHPGLVPWVVRAEKVMRADGFEDKWRWWHRRTERGRRGGGQCSKRDDSVDKVKLEIKPTDGGTKNVTCQVACGTPGRDRRIRTVGR